MSRCTYKKNHNMKRILYLHLPPFSDIHLTFYFELKKPSTIYLKLYNYGLNLLSVPHWLPQIKTGYLPPIFAIQPCTSCFSKILNHCIQTFKNLWNFSPSNKRIVFPFKQHPTKTLAKTLAKRSSTALNVELLTKTFSLVIIGPALNAKHINLLDSNTLKTSTYVSKRAKGA